MEMFYENIETVAMECLLDIYLVGKKVYETANETEDFSRCSEDVSETNLLIESINGINLTNDQKSQIRQLSLKNKVFVLLFDQLNKKFMAEIFQLEHSCLKFAIFFEMQKVKSFFKKIDEMEKLEAQLCVISKTFL